LEKEQVYEHIKYKSGIAINEMLVEVINQALTW
jgi:hypothetical protein